MQLPPTILSVDKNRKPEKTSPSAKKASQKKKEKEKKEEKTTPAKSELPKDLVIDDKKVGDGKAAKKGDLVSMRYIGKFQDSKKVFDSNTKGEPFKFKLGKGEVIKGWDMGIAGMQVGGERLLTIPAALAYGKRAQGGIPANSTLIFGTSN